ncbi:MAG: hypothetical protein ACPGYT_03920 [Nitrospirales bacterium]
MSVQFWVLAYSGELKSRVPPDQLEKAKSHKNPFTVTKEFIDQGRILYEGSAFCSACHGRDCKGRPSGRDTDPSAQPMPANFTDGAWQAARSDGDFSGFLKMGATEQIWHRFYHNM